MARSIEIISNNSTSIDTVYSFLNENKGTWFDTVTKTDATITCGKSGIDYFTITRTSSQYEYEASNSNETISINDYWSASANQYLVLISASGGVGVIFGRLESSFITRGGIIITTANTEVPMVASFESTGSNGAINAFSRIALSDNSNLFDFAPSSALMPYTMLIPVPAQSEVLTYSDKAFVMMCAQNRAIQKFTMNNVDYVGTGYMAIKD